ARRLAQLRRQRCDYFEIHLGQALWTRLPCGRRFHHPKWLGPDAIDSEPGGEGAGVMDGMVSRPVPAPLSDVLDRAFGLPHLAFVARLEKIDSRIVLSLLGLRFVNISMNFYYLNAAWWYFSMLIQFYLIFPLLFWGARKLGPWTFLLIASAMGFFARYLILVVYPQNGMWILGGFAISRLP